MKTTKTSKEANTNTEKKEEREKKKHSNYYIGGEKGGVGKSFFTRCLVDYFIYKGWDNSFVLVDADQSINDVISVYPDERYKTLRFSENQFEQDAPDLIVNHLADKTVVVNLPSNIARQFDTWAKRIGLLSSDFAEYCNTVVYFFITDGSYQSIRQFLAHIKKYPSPAITHCLAFNPGRLTAGGDFRYLENECPELLTALRDNKNIAVVLLPQLIPRYQFMVDRDNMPYRKLLELELYSDKVNAKDFLTPLDALLDKIFPNDISSPEGLIAIAKERRPFHEQLKLSYLYSNL